MGVFGGLDRIRGRQEDILTSLFALAHATGDAGINDASHHPVSAGTEGRTGTGRLPTAALHCRLALALVASFFALTIPLAPNAGAEESVVDPIFLNRLCITDTSCGVKARSKPF